MTNSGGGLRTLKYKQWHVKKVYNERTRWCVGSEPRLTWEGGGGGSGRESAA